MYKVVIVDDEYVSREWMSTKLPWQKWNCEVVATAYDGKDGLRMIERYMPDMIFSEIAMPRVNGIQMIEEVKAEFQNIEVSIMTGKKDFKSAQQAVNLGVRRFLLKPFDTEEVGEAVEAMLANVKKNDCRENSMIVRNAVRYIEEHYVERLTLAEVAERIYVSQWYLSKLLNKDTGQGFSEILNKTRIRHAKKLLGESSIRISEVAERVGFLDITYFSRVFKKYEGISANAYRGKLKK